MTTTRRLHLSAFLLAAVIGIAHLAAQQPQPRPTASQPPAAQPPTTPASDEPPVVFRSSIDAVAVDVAVVDGQGNPVRGLTIDDFELSVDGQPRAISSATYVSQRATDSPEVSPQYSTNDGAAGGRLIMIVVDQGNIRTGAGTRFIKAAGRLLDDLGPGDRVALAVLPGGQLVDFTNHLASIRSRLDQLMGGAGKMMGRIPTQRVGISEALAIERNDSHAFDAVADRECNMIRSDDEMASCFNELRLESVRTLDYVRAETTTSLLALRQLLARMQRVPRPKTLVLLSEGLIIDRRFGDVSWVSAAAASARASLYAVVLDDTFADLDTSINRASPSASQDRQLRLEGIQTLVGLARGASFEVVAGAASAYERLSRELTGYYLVAFEAHPSERDGKAHQISVRVKRKGIEVRARREFAVDLSANAARTDEETLGEALRDPLLATDRRVSVATYSFPDPASSNVRVLIAAGFGAADGAVPVRAVAYRILDSQGRIAGSRLDEVKHEGRGEQQYLATVTLPAGTYSLKIAGLDADGNRGSVEHLFKAGLTSVGGLTTGDLMVGEEEDSATGLRPSIAPVVRGAALTSYLELLGKDAASFSAAAVRVEIAAEANSATLLSVDGAIGDTKNPARRVVEARVGVGDLPAGPYVARAVVSVGGRTVGRVTRDFRFDPSAEVLAGAFSPIGRVPAFDRASVLRGDVVTPLLARVEAVAPDAANAPGVPPALAAARAGDFAALPDLVAKSTDSGVVTAFLRGLGYFARGELEPAASEFRKTIAAAPDDFVPGTFFLGACYAAGGRDSQAVGAWQTMLAAESKLPAAVFGLAADAYVRMHDWEGAAAAADEGLVIDPADDALALKRADALAMAGRVGESLAAYDRYLERHPSDTDVLFAALRAAYRARVTATTVVGDREDRARFERYYRAYVTANGPRRALAERWSKALSPDQR